MKAYNKSPGDRTGSQINEAIFVYAHCLKKGLDYVGAYGENRCVLNHFANYHKLSEMLNLPLPVRTLPAAYASYIEIKPQEYSKEVYPDHNLLLDAAFIQKLRDSYFSSVAPPTRTAPLHVAVHMRRGDVKMSNLMRYIPNEYYLDTIKKLKKLEPQAEIAVFSEADSSESFQDFRELGCKLHLDADLAFTWKEMTFADVLVMSKGSFAYVPAIYNKNFVISYPAWYSQLGHWHSKDDPDLWEKLKSFIDQM